MGKEQRQTYSDVLIIGAGASGLMCAAVAALRGRRVTVLERSGSPARKVLASGGGRCNFTNMHADPSHYISANPHFARSALARFTPEDALTFLKRHRISFEEREEGKVFLSRSASQVAEALMKDAQEAGANVELKTEILAVAREAAAFTIKTSRGTYHAPKLLLAMGGKSWKSLGATGLGYQLALQFGHKVTELRPGLVPFVLKDKGVFSGLNGLSFEAGLSTPGYRVQGQALVTHRGLSGPVVLQASSYWREGEPVILDLMPGEDALEVLRSAQSGRMELKTLISHYLPRRLAINMARQYGENIRLSALTGGMLKEAAHTLNHMELTPSGTEGFRKAEVTVGGVSTKDISSKTLGSLITPGLFFTGELLDVTGELGGFNLHWAWASANAAGRAV